MNTRADYLQLAYVVAVTATGFMLGYVVGWLANNRHRAKQRDELNRHHKRRLGL